MLNIVVINCDNKYIEYEWDSLEHFVADLDSDNENIPMLDDTLAEVNTNDESLNEWWRNSIDNKVIDLYEECKQRTNLLESEL